MVVESEGINQRLPQGLTEPSSKHGVALGVIISQAVMRAAGGGPCLPGLVEGFAGGQKRS
jgi:hypothetical protein